MSMSSTPLFLPVQAGHAYPFRERRCVQIDLTMIATCQLLSHALSMSIHGSISTQEFS
jgi:hypothetical protein